VLSLKRKGGKRMCTSTERLGTKEKESTRIDFEKSRSEAAERLRKVDLFQEEMDDQSRVTIDVLMLEFSV
jgi:hypothetical protein